MVRAQKYGWDSSDGRNRGPREPCLRGLPVKLVRTIGSAGALLAGTVSFATAGSLPDPLPDSAVLSPDEILAEVRYFGLDAAGQPVRRGPYYVLHAYDGTGIELRVVVDAQFGDILFSAPALNAALTPPYVRAARIIQVPSPDERNGNGAPKKK